MTYKFEYNKKTGKWTCDVFTIAAFESRLFVYTDDCPVAFCETIKDAKRFVRHELRTMGNFIKMLEADELAMRMFDEIRCSHKESIGYLTSHPN